MKYKSARQGWYKLTNPYKYRRPLDETMGSSVDGFVKYKSSLEYNAIRYADMSYDVQWWSLEPFPIPYVKPTDGKVHRYFPDMLISRGGQLILVEIKSHSETQMPKRPFKNTPLTHARYNEAMQTYYINQAKWAAARQMCAQRNMVFCVLTERDLKS